MSRGLHHEQIHNYAKASDVLNGCEIIQMFLQSLCISDDVSLHLKMLKSQFVYIYNYECEVKLVLYKSHHFFDFNNALKRKLTMSVERVLHIVRSSVTN